MSVRCKFICQKKTESNHGGGANNGWFVEMTPVTGDSPEDKEFYKWTPSGQVNLGLLNPAAAERFEVGKAYYLDITPAE